MKLQVCSTNLTPLILSTYSHDKISEITTNCNSKLRGLKTKNFGPLKGGDYNRRTRSDPPRTKSADYSPKRGNDTIQMSRKTRVRSYYLLSSTQGTVNSGANLYLGLGGIIQEILQFFRKSKL